MASHRNRRSKNATARVCAAITVRLLYVNGLHKKRMRCAKIIAVFARFIGEPQQAIDGTPHIRLRYVDVRTARVGKRFCVDSQSARLLHFDSIDTRNPVKVR